MSIKSVQSARLNGHANYFESHAEHAKVDTDEELTRVFRVSCLHYSATNESIVKPFINIGKVLEIHRPEHALGGPESYALVKVVCFPGKEETIVVAVDGMRCTTMSLDPNEPAAQKRFGKTTVITGSVEDFVNGGKAKQSQSFAGNSTNWQAQPPSAAGPIQFRESSAARPAFVTMDGRTAASTSRSTASSLLTAGSNLVFTPLQRKSSAAVSPPASFISRNPEAGPNPAHVHAHAHAGAHSLSGSTSASPRGSSGSGSGIRDTAVVSVEDNSQQQQQQQHEQTPALSVQTPAQQLLALSRPMNQEGNRMGHSKFSMPPLAARVALQEFQKERMEANAAKARIEPESSHKLQRQEMGKDTAAVGGGSEGGADLQSSSSSIKNINSTTNGSVNESKDGSGSGSSSSSSSSFGLAAAWEGDPRRSRWGEQSNAAATLTTLTTREKEEREKEKEGAQKNTGAALRGSALVMAPPAASNVNPAPKELNRLQDKGSYVPIPPLFPFSGNSSTVGFRAGGSDNSNIIHNNYINNDDYSINSSNKPPTVFGGASSSVAVRNHSPIASSEINHSNNSGKNPSDDNGGEISSSVFDVETHVPALTTSRSASILDTAAAAGDGSSSRKNGDAAIDDAARNDAAILGDENKDAGMEVLLQTQLAALLSANLPPSEVVEKLRKSFLPKEETNALAAEDHSKVQSQTLDRESDRFPFVDDRRAERDKRDLERSRDRSGKVRERSRDRRSLSPFDPRRESARRGQRDVSPTERRRTSASSQLSEKSDFSKSRLSSVERRDVAVEKENYRRRISSRFPSSHSASPLRGRSRSADTIHSVTNKQKEIYSDLDYEKSLSDLERLKLRKRKREELEREIEKELEKERRYLSVDIENDYDHADSRYPKYRSGSREAARRRSVSASAVDHKADSGMRRSRSRSKSRSKPKTQKPLYRSSSADRRSLKRRESYRELDRSAAFPSRSGHSPVASHHRGRARSSSVSSPTKRESYRGRSGDRDRERERGRVERKGSDGRGNDGTRYSRSPLRRSSSSRSFRPVNRGSRSASRENRHKNDSYRERDREYGRGVGNGTSDESKSKSEPERERSRDLVRRGNDAREDRRYKDHSRDNSGDRDLSEHRDRDPDRHRSRRYSSRSPFSPSPSPTLKPHTQSIRREDSPSPSSRHYHPRRNSSRLYKSRSDKYAQSQSPLTSRVAAQETRYMRSPSRSRSRSKDRSVSRPSLLLSWENSGRSWDKISGERARGTDGEWNRMGGQDKYVSSSGNWSSQDRERQKEATEKNKERAKDRDRRDVLDRREKSPDKPKPKWVDNEKDNDRYSPSRTQKIDSTATTYKSFPATAATPAASVSSSSVTANPSVKSWPSARYSSVFPTVTNTTYSAVPAEAAAAAVAPSSAALPSAPSSSSVRAPVSAGDGAAGAPRKIAINGDKVIRPGNYKNKGPAPSSLRWDFRKNNPNIAAFQQRQQQQQQQQQQGISYNATNAAATTSSFVGSSPSPSTTGEGIAPAPGSFWSGGRSIGGACSSGSGIGGMNMGPPFRVLRYPGGGPLRAMDSLHQLSSTDGRQSQHLYSNNSNNNNSNSSGGYRGGIGRTFPPYMDAGHEWGRQWALVRAARDQALAEDAARARAQQASAAAEAATAAATAAGEVARAGGTGGGISSSSDSGYGTARRSGDSANGVKNASAGYSPASNESGTVSAAAGSGEGSKASTASLKGSSSSSSSSSETFVADSYIGERYARAEDARGMIRKGRGRARGGKRKRGSDDEDHEGSNTRVRSRDRI